MAGRLSFSIAINLLTENFKKGTNQVKTALRSIQMQVLTFAAALGAGGLGLSNLVSRFIDVSRETGRATTALKNVSGSMAQYADNQRYLLDLAKKYGLEVNALTANYAQFTAAASISGMAVEEQRKVFESVSRACTAFGMSANDSNGVMLALSQMMSKGKVSSEELRLQMGERLPVALQAMAKAAGTSVAGLDKLMKEGKLLSKEVLPGFADALNGMIPHVDTDNLETSINRLKNAFTELANGADVQGKYKALVDWLAGALQSIQSKISGLVAFVITLLSGKLLTSIIGYFSRFWGIIDTTINKAKVAEEQKLLFTQRRIEAEKVLEATKTAYEIRENGKRLASAAQLKKAKDALERAQLAEKKAIEAEKSAAENAAAVRTTSVWGKATKTIGLGFTRVITSLKSLWAAAWPMALIAVIGAVIGKLVNMYTEAKRIKNIFSDYKAEAEKVGNTQEVVMLKTQLGIMNDKKKSQKEINSAQAQLQKMLGVENKSQEELNKLVAKRVKLLEETAKAQYYAGKIPEAEDNNRELVRKFQKDHGGEAGYSMDDMIKTISDYGYMNKSGLPMGFRTKYGLSGTETEIRQVIDEYIENLRILSDARENIKKAQVNANALSGNTNVGGSEDTNKTPLQKAEEQYAKSLRELDAQKEIGLLTDAQYYKAVDDLAKKMIVEARASGDREILTSDYLKMLEDVLTNPLYTGSMKAETELAEVQKEYQKSVSLAKAKLDRKLITEEEYRQALVEAATAAANSAISIENIGTAADGFIKNMQGVAGENLRVEMPKLGKRDTTFDYKKTGSDKLSEELDIWIEYRDNLKEKLSGVKDKASGVAKELEEKLTNAMSKVGTLEDALKLSQVREDIKALDRELDESVYSGVKDIAGSADRVVNAFSSLRDVMNDVDATEWEKIMAVWNAMVNVVDSFLSIAKMIENITELTDKLGEAKKEEVAIETAITGKKIANKTAETATEANALAVQTATEVAAGKIKTATATTEMAAKSTAAYAGIPFAGVGLASAQIAAMMALIEGTKLAAPGFKTGGVYRGGTSFGDKGLARLNKGEMILNMSQQSNLFNAINSGSLGGNSHLTLGFDKVRVDGKYLELAINNSRKKQGKKPL